MGPDLRTKEVPLAGAEGWRGVWQKERSKRQGGGRVWAPGGHCRSSGFTLGEVRAWEGLEQIATLSDLCSEGDTLAAV